MEKRQREEREDEKDGWREIIRRGRDEYIGNRGEGQPKRYRGRKRQRGEYGRVRER